MQFLHRIAVYSYDGTTLIGYYGAKFVSPLLAIGRASVQEKMKVKRLDASGRIVKENAVKAIRLEPLRRKLKVTEMGVNRGSFGIDRVHSDGVVYFQHHHSQLYDGLAVMA